MENTEKIFTLSEFLKVVKHFKKTEKKIVQCHGTFDLMHPGHVYYFEAAKKLGDVLIVTLTGDKFVKKGIGRPVFSQELRAYSIAALFCVDYVVIIPYVDSLKAIKKIKPDIYVKGNDYQSLEHVKGHPTWKEKKVLDRYGGRLHFTKEPVTFSSSALLNKYFSSATQLVKDFLQTLRSHVSFSSLEAYIMKMKSLRVLVVGDAILDRYHYASPLGRSAKEDIQRVKVQSSETFLGGALAIANTLANFCDTVGVISILGGKNVEKEKTNQKFIHTYLHKNVTPYFIIRPGAPTTVNERFVDYESYKAQVLQNTHVSLRKFFGLYEIDDSPLNVSVEARTLKVLARHIPNYDLVLVADFGLGLCSPKIIDLICTTSRYLAVNTQINSINFGYNYITKYPRADYISISLPEIRLALQAKNAPVEDLIKKIAQQLKTKAVSVTLGQHGAMTYDGVSFQRIPVFSSNVVDKIGAGDVYFALSTLSQYLRAPSYIIGFIGGMAASLSCEIIANKDTVHREMLLTSLKATLNV